jgi:hypothetical protein
LLDRPKPTAGCSANGRRRRRRMMMMMMMIIIIIIIIIMLKCRDLIKKKWTNYEYYFLFCR